MRKTMTEQGMAQPVLHRDQIDAIIGDLMWASKTRAPSSGAAIRDETTAYLVAFYTRRWGLPPAVRAGADRAAV